MYRVPIIEGISRINIETLSKPVINYRFEEDLDRVYSTELHSRLKAPLGAKCPRLKAPHFAPKGA